MIGQLDRIRELEKLNSTVKNNSLKKIVAVASGKGGTGKTFFAANLAFLYSKHSKVLLIDLDFNLSNLHLLLNIHPQNTLSDFFQSKCLFSEMITPYNSNLEIIYGDSGLTTNIKPALSQINRLITEINNVINQYDLIILDLGAGVNEENISILKRTHIKVIVTNPEPTAVMDAYVVIKTLKSINAEQDCYIVVNRIVEENESNETFKNLNSATEHFLKTKVNFLVSIAESTEVRRSIIDQKLLAISTQSSIVIGAIKSAAERIIKIHQVLNINQPSIPTL